MTESRIEKLTRIGQEMAAAVAEMRADAADVTNQNPETAALVEELSVTCDRWSQWEEVAAVALTHLQSTGRLIPAGGMALTAEQVEDVRTVVNNSPMEIYDAKERGLYYAAAARLRALFPATEPATDRLSRNPEAVTDLKAYAANPADVAPVQLRGNIVAECNSLPAPAEPAEEETKAETRPPLLTPNQIRDANPGKHETFIFGQQRADGTACVGCSWQTYEVLDTIRAVAEHDDAKGLVHDHAVWITKNGICPCGHPASSPVVPAPTETGPWMRIEDVPKSVYLIKDCEGDKWRRDRKSWEVYSERGFRWHPGFPDRFAPFVAAEESL
ncbi:hypothetical protein [Rhodococcus erythropolis]|nr:hypothetical protein [Rhodococcus erythropolis]